MPDIRKRKSNSSVDFKRVKAKVGKKAQKRPNDTDVSFKSASLRITGQSIQHDNINKDKNRHVLLSSRGKLLVDLLSQINHPAVNVRVSSLKGVLDVIKNHPPEYIVPNLSILIPACVHSCVDDNQDVRSLGIDSLSALLKKMDEETIRPFSTLVIARVLSALHSLDASTRIDGVKMTKLVASSCPSITTTFVDKLLHPFPNLLADQQTKKIGLDEMLQTLTSLFRVTTTKRHLARTKSSISSSYSTYSYGNRTGTNTNTNQLYDLTYISMSPGSRNSILIEGRPIRFPNVERISMNYNKRKRLTNLVSPRIKYKINLISKLRDILLETIHEESKPILASSNKMSKTTTKESLGGIKHTRLILVLRSIRCLNKNFVSFHGDDSNDNCNEFHKLQKQISSLLMETFPINLDSSSMGEASKVEEANAVIIFTILEVMWYEKDQKFSSVLNHDKNGINNRWMKAICLYAIPRMKRIGDISSATSSSLNLDITCQVVRQHGRGCGLTRDMNTMLGILQDIFLINDDIQLARSASCRRISLLVMDLIEDTNFHIADTSSSTIGNILSQFVTKMLFYLEAWASDFIYESEKVFQVIHKLIVQLDDNYDSTIVECLRNDLFRFVKHRGNSPSIFETYPLHLKEMFLSLMVLLRNPNDLTLNGLASICTRLTMSDEGYFKKETLVEAIMQSIQSIRKTVPMQRYLTFLLQSIGISSHVKKMLRVEAISMESELSHKNIFEGAFFTPDLTLNIVARILIQSGSMKVLEMIYPQLSTWLQTIVKGESTIEFLLKARSCHIILAFFFLLHAKQQQLNGNQTSIFDTMNGVLSASEVADSICRFIHCILHKNDAMTEISKVISPAVAIMSTETSILHSVIYEMTDWFKVGRISKNDQSNLLRIFLDWMKDPRLKQGFSGSTTLSKKVLELIRIVTTVEHLQDPPTNTAVVNLVALLSTTTEM